jgi:hypothetical protein
MTQREQKIFMNIYGSIAFPCGQRPKGSWSFVFKTKICYEKTVRDLRAFRKGEYRRELANYATE